MLGLPPLEEPDFNRYIKKHRLDDWLKSLNLAFRAEDFSSLYYLGSRVLREIIQKNPLANDYFRPGKQGVL